MAQTSAPLRRGTGEEIALEERIRQILRDLGRVLSEGLNDSSAVDELLRRVRDQGYDLIIVVDRSGGRGNGDGVSPGPGAEASGAAAGRRLRLATDGRPGGPDAGGGAAGTGPPEFRIDAADLAFLRSVGIDPTRKVRGRKRSGSEQAP